MLGTPVWVTKGVNECMDCHSKLEKKLPIKVLPMKVFQMCSSLACLPCICLSSSFTAQYASFLPYTLREMDFMCVFWCACHAGWFWIPVLHCHPKLGWPPELSIFRVFIARFLSIFQNKKPAWCSIEKILQIWPKLHVAVLQISDKDIKGRR